MSDDILSVIPTDPHWQPGPAAGERAAALVAELAPGHPDGVEAEIEIDWYDALTFVDCGADLRRVGCPHCGAAIDRSWYDDLLDAHEDGFPSLTVTVPCCDTRTSLDLLEYDGRCGFARFEIAVWNPERLWFSDEELSAVGQVLGHPVRQIRTHL
ncbi:hypothetical protein [Streptomyces sp. NPDC005209]|uniref:hypothetical protein n=1 Tax=Streptomyces sp. NPDC005209 TaxID=3156715 RepID=UPI0033A0401F